VTSSGRVIAVCRERCRESPVTVDLRQPKFRGYEVTLDVWPDVFAYGILLLPKDLKQGERRPVVCASMRLKGGLDVADSKLDAPAYHRHVIRLAEEGFITFAPRIPTSARIAFAISAKRIR
jgi:hypothetical protein